MQYEHLTPEERNEYHAWLDEMEAKDRAVSDMRLRTLSSVKPLVSYTEHNTCLNMEAELSPKETITQQHSPYTSGQKM